MFKDIISQNKIAKLINQQIKNKRVPHAVLFHGPGGSGKLHLGLAYAKALNCEVYEDDFCDECLSCRKIDNFSHPDIHFIMPIKKSISPEQITELLIQKSSDPSVELKFPGNTNILISQIREVNDVVNSKPYEGKYKIIIIKDADSMNIQAANALLKSLEEPSNNTLFILTAEHKERLLQTIISRCLLFEFNPLSNEKMKTIIEENSEEKINFNNKKIEKILKIANGNLLQFYKLYENNLEEYEYYMQILETILKTDFYGIQKTADVLSKKWNRTEIIEFINVYQKWMFDIVQMKYMQDNYEKLINTERKELIMSLIKNKEMNEETFLNLNKSLEEIVMYVKRNVNTYLILINTFLLIRKSGVKLND